MNAQEVNRSFDLLTLAENETTLKKAGSYHVGPCPFCGGRDRFTIKHTRNGDRWHCRKCGDGKYHTPIDYLMQRDGLDFKAALKQMGGDVMKSDTSREKPTRPPISLPDDTWQRAAWDFIMKAHDRLLSPEGMPGRKELVRRRFNPATCGLWLLGFAEVWGRPAIVIPWMDMDASGDMITAVKYRFIGAKGGKRFGMLKGSVPILFGLHNVTDYDRALMLVEGEFNAMSIRQCEPSRIAVVSVGSESGGRPEMLKALASRFEHVIIWTDDKEQSARIEKAIERKAARRFQSPKDKGIKWDANQFLQAGLLADFLTDRLGVPCLGEV